MNLLAKLEDIKKRGTQPVVSSKIFRRAKNNGDFVLVGYHRAEKIAD